MVVHEEFYIDSNIINKYMFEVNDKSSKQNGEMYMKWTFIVQDDENKRKTSTMLLRNKKLKVTL